MPSHFTLTRKGADKPSALVLIDKEMCQYFGVTVNDARYYMDWNYTIGFGLALGKSWEQLEEIFNTETAALKIIEYLRNNYTADSWFL